MVLDRDLKSFGPSGFLRQGRVLGGKSKTLPDGGYAKLTLICLLSKEYARFS